MRRLWHLDRCVRFTANNNDAGELEFQGLDLFFQIGYLSQLG